MKKIFITNGSGTAGKDSFVTAVGKYVPVYKYSAIDLVKDMLEVAGISRTHKTEEIRLLMSDMKDMLTEYGDIPFKDVSAAIADFKNGLVDADVMFIDIREPDEIARAVKEFGAKTILVRNPNANKIDSNHADRDVENYEYDYIIENNGTLEQLEKMAKLFAQRIIIDGIYPYSGIKPYTFVCSDC